MIKKFWFASLLLLMTSVSLAQESFVVSDINVKGLQRISAGAVFNLLPIQVGDTFFPSESSDLIREVYASGFFKSIEISTEGSVLTLDVIEYPSIANIEFAGNKLIKEESLRDALASNDFTEGEVFKPDVLEQVKQELARQYLNQGKYNAQVGTEVIELPRNRIKVILHVKEGPTAKIKKINIVGNEFFSDNMLLKEFESKDDVPFWKFWGSSDQYSKEKLSGDIETLRSFYQDRGFLDFRVVSNQVSISPEKDSIFLTVNIEEGKRYIVSQFVLNGRLIVSEEELMRYVYIAPGQTYSRKDVDDTVKILTDRLAIEGYSAAEVVPVPDIDRENATVGYSINIKPGRRVYVRRIDVTGNTVTNDNVIRRELRQHEGAAYSPNRVNRSKTRLQRLSFFETVEIESIPVEGREDQVDLAVQVVERPTGSFSAGVGFSGDNGAILQLSIAQANLFGTGNSVNFAINRSEFVESASVQFTDPYHTKSGVSRTISLTAQSIDSDAAQTSAFVTDSIALNVNYLFPINESNSFSIGGGFEKVDLESTRFSVRQVINFIDGDPDVPGDNGSPDNNLFNINLAFAHDTRDSLIYPTSGKSLRVALEATLPGSDLEFFRASIDGNYYIPLTRRAAIKLEGGFAYGDGYGDTDALPFFKNYFAGGSSSVRGFEARSLGPRDGGINGIDDSDEAFGGSSRVILKAALLLPLGGTSLDRRLQLFLDGGQVYAPDASIDLSEVRFSAGVGFNWLSPVGPLSLSFAVPLNDEEDDETEGFQFSVGTLIQ